jgi:hypothetical protein
MFMVANWTYLTSPRVGEHRVRLDSVELSLGVLPD